MQRLTSYRVSRGPDGSRDTYTNWYEEAVHIAFTDGYVRFYSEFPTLVTNYRKIYIPIAGEHLEITGEPQ